MKPQAPTVLAGACAAAAIAAITASAQTADPRPAPNIALCVPRALAAEAPNVAEVLPGYGATLCPALREDGLALLMRGELRGAAQPPMPASRPPGARAASASARFSAPS
ncbi:MAG: hypothetical protein NXH82_07685 [Rhodobacteraceae bacterium]|nr:hypothetical protein [Paracoccaceae bacterium]